jgi:hypothetical protein
MDRQQGETAGNEPRPREATGGVDQRRAIGGGVALLVAVLGFTAVQAVVEGAVLPDEWVLVALPAFGLVGVVGFVLLVSAVVRG